LKCAAVRHLDYNELRAFLGLAPSDQRLRVFERLRGDLTGAAQRYWTGNAEALRTGVVSAGKYESFIRLFSRVLGVLQGKKRIAGLFRCQTLERQQVYFEKKWNTLQWRLLFKLFANKWVLARRGLTADYFKFDDGSSSFSESFLRRARRAICEIPVESNYFLAQYLLAQYRSEEAVPAYLLRENLPIVRQRLDRIEIVTSDAQSWLGRQPNRSIDAFSLSNICELMSPEETGRLFAAVTRAARVGARVCFRNLMVPRGVPETLASEIELNEELSRHLLAEDRSLVYSRVQAFVVHSRSRSDRRPVMTG
jgi:S-adenosylmethionine-diacylglycerol 3-amino-3-carboxypropyl transferase